MYCTSGEISIPQIKGILGFFFQLMISTGTVVSSLLGLGLDWRWISAILSIIPLISVALMITLPESPYFSLKQGDLYFL